MRHQSSHPSWRTLWSGTCCRYVFASFLNGSCQVFSPFFWILKFLWNNTLFLCVWILVFSNILVPILFFCWKFSSVSFFITRWNDENYRSDWPGLCLFCWWAQHSVLSVNRVDFGHFLNLPPPPQTPRPQLLLPADSSVPPLPPRPLPVCGGIRVY